MKRERLNAGNAAAGVERGPEYLLGPHLLSWKCSRDSMEARRLILVWPNSCIV